MPNSSLPYIEHIYDVSTLKLLGEYVKYPEKTIKIVLNRQNPNGGFARSDIGISTLRILSMQ